MSSYECPACTYYTDSSKSFRMHSNQCAELQRAQEEQEERLSRKRKLLAPGSGFIDWERLRSLKRAHVEEQQGIPNHTEGSLESQPNQQDLVEELADSGTSVAAHADCGAVCMCDLSHPNYRPVLGRFRDQYDRLPEVPPEPFTSAGTTPTTAAPEPTAAQAPRSFPRGNQIPAPYATLPDSFGQYRVYPSKPHTIPDAVCELSDISDVQMHPTSDESFPARSISDIVSPCPNISAFRLQYWHWMQGNKKTRESRVSLVRDVISAPDFIASDVLGLNWRQMDKDLATDSQHSPAGWKSGSISITVPPRTPAAAAAISADPKCNRLAVPGFEHRSLTSTIVDAFTKNNQRFFHYMPYTAFCVDPQTSTEQRIYGEVYESQKMLDAHNEIQAIVLDEECSLPRCAAMLMVFSDATQLANFGHASVWPIRVSFGNLSKYERCKPNSKNHYEVGHIPPLPADLQEQLHNLDDGKPVPKALLTHIRRELLHEVWNQLLDDEFLTAWRQGIVIKCADGVTRRVFPRIFSYSADYMEKILLATIRGMRSLRPCPRCLIPKAKFPNLGLAEDQRQRLELKRIDDNARNKLVADARSIIYTDGRAVNSKGVELLLKPWSYAPTQNAFSRRLRLLGFDIFESLTVDLLHEYELGVWKSVFQHIIRILHSLGSKSVSKFNARFRLMPTFGDGTIRPFSEDVSDMTRPAARNYEDILQCIIPAIEGLLPPAYEQQVLTLLFVMAQWHALAKLRKHTTTRLGHELRQFRDCTSSLEIYETPREVASRQRRTRKRARPRAALALDEDCFNEVDATAPIRKRKYFSLETSKVHALGDYPEAVRTRGTTDSFSTQTGELLHRGTKQRYTRTNGRNYLPQMSEIERIEARLNDIGDELQKHEQGPTTNSETALIAEDLPTMDSGRSPYQMAVSQKNQVLISAWADRNHADPAVESYVLRLKSHLLARLSGKNYQDESACSADELAQITFHFDRIYAHQTLKIHYTTYDVRRAQDIVNPHTPKRFVLVPSNEVVDSGSGAHRFWYAKVLGIYHANVCYRGLAPKRMDFLWVRWLGRALDAPGGWDTCRLDRVAYFPDADQTHAFDFVDPVDVIRAAHLIPRFLDDRTTQFLGGVPSIATDDKELGDWKSYYVNRFVDRDMLMRFTGMAIGHVSQRSTAGYKSGVPVATVNSGYEYLASTEQESNEKTAEAESTDPNGAEGSDIEDDYDHADGEGDSGDDGDSDESDDGSGDEQM